MMNTDKKHKILFVCLGNICRSPAAEEILRVIARKSGKNWEIDSAGTYSGHKGELPDRRMYAAARKRGYNLTHRARPVSIADFIDFDIIMAMDDDNYETLRKMAPDIKSEDKVVRIRDFFNKERNDTYVPDPYYSGADGFEYVLDLLEEACGNRKLRFQRLRDLAPSSSSMTRSKSSSFCSRLARRTLIRTLSPRVNVLRVLFPTMR